MIPRQAMSSTTFVQTTNYLTFLTSIHLSPCLTTLPLYPINIPKPSLGGGGFETCSAVSLLGCLVNKPFLCCKPQRLCVQFAASQSIEPGSVTLCCYWSTKWIDVGEWNIKFININPNHHASQRKVHGYSVTTKSLSPSLKWAEFT